MCENNVYFLEGLIGIGKTSILSELKRRHSEIKIFYEPIIDYQHLVGSNPLMDFYLNIPGSVFRFQLIAMASNYENFLISKNTDCDSIIERSFDSSFNVFTRSLYDTGSLSPVEYGIIEKFYNIFNIKCAKTIIYLKGSPALCMERIKKRARAEELGVSIEYLELIEWFYEKFMQHSKKIGCVVHEIEADQAIGVIADKIYDLMMMN